MSTAAQNGAPTPRDQRGEALAASFPPSDPPAITAPLIANLAHDEHAGSPADGEVAIFRVVSAKGVADAFSTARNRDGGRWTSPGTPAVYVSLSPAGALLEFLAHLEGESPDELRMLSATIPRDRVIVADALPVAWRERPYRPEVRALGDAWAKAQHSLALQVPSVLCEGVANALINPEHADAGRVQVRAIDALHIDPRLRY